MPGLVSGSSGIPTFVHAVAKASIEKLSRHINAGDIRLRGDLRRHDPPADIDKRSVC
jgi:hypothetical protein